MQRGIGDAKEKIMEKQDIKSFTMEELAEKLCGMGHPAYRASQVYGWLHSRLAGSFEEITNLPKAMRKELAEAFRIVSLTPVEIKVSKIDGTRKYLFALSDGTVIESVWMKYRHGNSVCISSQAGCRMGCKFCASTLDGLERSLLPSEMLDQVYQIQKETGERVSNVVVMGSGEPFDNYENLVRFIRLLSSREGLNISQRNITISTCGIVPGILRLAKEGLPVTLALSLHAPNDGIREKLMPIAKTYKLDQVLEACRAYFRETGRRVTYEYSLVKGVNDSLKDARALGALLKKQQGHINLIPVNPIKERTFRQSDQTSIQAFKNVLEKNGINVTIRREMGRDINGACGQLRKSFLETR